MAFIRGEFKEYHNDYAKANFSFNFEEESDLYHFLNKNDIGFFNIIINSNLKLFNKVLNPNDFYGRPHMWCMLIQNVKFETKSSSVKDSIRYSSDNLEDLGHQILLHFGNNLIEWNRNFISTFENQLNFKSFKNEVEKNIFLNSLHSQNISDEEIWYNKHKKIFNNKILNTLNQLVSHISKIENELLVEIPSIPSIDTIPLPKFNFLDKLLGEDKVKMSRYEEAVNKRKEEIYFKENQKREREALNNKFKNELREIKEYLKAKIEFISFELNGANEKRISEYESGNNINNFVDCILKYSILNTLFNFSYSTESIADGHLICDISLLNDNEISKIKSYKEFKRDERIEPVYYNEKDFKKLCDSIIYSVYFRVIIEIFKSDYCSHIKQLTLNGWVNALNRKNGKYENKCIMSLSLSRNQFEDIDFSNVDLKEAFRHLKGISSASLIDFVPIAPIISINKSDKRFIQSEEVLKNISDSTNIAAVDWEEFEHLVRELFEKEFAVNGGEVKVTQSSRDGGVDAIAFDPDPIRGGKIVIQSKRYTNVVGVSAIRDLYGTVMNEGATKGIIVTTSHYGSDAYEFAKGKPLTLLDGNNLLALLQKHGYNARINIEEAKNLNKE